MSTSKWELSFRAMTLGKFHTRWHDIYLNPSQKHSGNLISHGVSNHLPAPFSAFTTYTHRQKFLIKIFILLVNRFHFIWCFFCMCMCVGLYMCMRRPEIDMGCLPQLPFTLFTEARCLDEPELAYLVKISSQSAPGIIFPPSTSQSLGLPTWLLCNCWRPKL